jgi:hypothetical protein
MGGIRGSDFPMLGVRVSHLPYRGFTGSPSTHLRHYALNLPLEYPPTPGHFEGSHLPGGRVGLRDPHLSMVDIRAPDLAMGGIRALQLAIGCIRAQTYRWRLLGAHTYPGGN